MSAEPRTQPPLIQQLMERAHVRACRSEIEAHTEWCPRFQAAGTTWGMVFHHFNSMTIIPEKSDVHVRLDWRIQGSPYTPSLDGVVTGQFPGRIPCVINRTFDAGEAMDLHDFVRTLARASAEMIHEVATAPEVQNVL